MKGIEEYMLETQSDDSKSLGVTFGKKYEKDILSALVNFLDGIETIIKDDDDYNQIMKIRNEIA